MGRCHTVGISLHYTEIRSFIFFPARWNELRNNPKEEKDRLSKHTPVKSECCMEHL